MSPSCGKQYNNNNTAEEGEGCASDTNHAKKVVYTLELLDKNKKYKTMPNKKIEPKRHGIYYSLICC